MIYINLLIIILLLIFIHELGHYSAARLFRVKVSDFSIGFGKSIFSYKDRFSTNWKLSLIPLGGYVKIKGLESIFQKVEQKNYDSDSFQSLSLFKKIIILLAGSFFNILSAWICLFCILFFFGIATFSPEVGKVLENSPASMNDIREGDIISRVNGYEIKDFSDISRTFDKSNFVSIEIVRNNDLILKEFELKYNNEMNKYIIGISSTNTPIINRFSLFNSLTQSIIFIPTYYYATFDYLIKSINNKTITKELAGPIGMVKMADQLMLDKLKGVMFMFIMISLFVGIFNLIPIPLLDGGHIIYFTLRSIFADSLPHIVTRIYLTIGITIISFIFIFVTLNDIFYK
ncbi:MAG: site-2 protease family protein [Pelagibacteraceae bacterium]|jgi:regulator of sigma E protease|nr:site-2 protease family protein [Pelagibacteraceae bacterium]MDP6784522.1 M50 family metallopeptidase [Alphaproteobacteria bacterium]